MLLTCWLPVCRIRQGDNNVFLYSKAIQSLRGKDIAFLYQMRSQVRYRLLQWSLIVNERAAFEIVKDGASLVSFLYQMRSEVRYRLLQWSLIVNERAAFEIVKDGASLVSFLYQMRSEVRYRLLQWSLIVNERAAFEIVKVRCISCIISVSDEVRVKV